MKKRILLGVVALTLLMTLIFPAQLMAKCDDKYGGESFTATAEVYVTDPGVIKVTDKNGFIVRDQQIGEIICGTIDKSKGWNELKGATLTIVHNADSIYNLKAGTFTAIASGTMTITLLDNSVLSGTYKATLSGNFTGTTYETVAYTYTSVTDLVSWSLESGNNTVALGTAIAQLFPYPKFNTMAGGMSLTGVHY